jgi:hypothetical protein
VWVEGIPVETPGGIPYTIVSAAEAAGAHRTHRKPTMPEKDETRKIIVDDDYKKQAQAEKEKLAHEVETPGAGGAGGAEGREIPPASFTTLVGSLVSQVFMALGGYEDPRTKRRYIDLQLAKHYIDLLSVLEEKTKGNISPEEKKLLDSALYETRMQYVQIAQRATQM